MIKFWIKFLFAILNLILFWQLWPWFLWLYYGGWGIT